MARAAKISGGGTSLLPKEMTSTEEMPWDLALAIEHAMRILSWQENLLGKEMPPDWMLPFDKELEIWFERVDRERKEKYGDDSGDDREQVDMMENEFSARFK